MVVVLRQLQEQTKTVKNYRAYQLSPKASQLQEAQRGQVRLSSDLSDPVTIANGVKQGYVIMPSIFTIFSTLYRNRLPRMLIKNTLFTSATILMAAYSMSGDCKPTKTPWNN